jgi:RloB-like protein
MPRRRDDLRRRKPIREPRPRVLVCCEGEVTEPSYFKGLKRKGQNNLLDVEVRPGGSNPKTLVDFAAGRKKDTENQARRQRDDNLRYDEIWCVFDVDTHDHIPDAKQKAAANHIDLAISNPCFELWLLLHFQEQHAHIERRGVQSACRQHMPGYDKEVPFDEIFPRYQDGVKRAQALEHWQETRGCAGENPSTGVHRLTERIMELGREQQIKQHQALRRY